MLKSLSDAQNPLNIMEIRTASDIEVCDALVLPGGESTAMRIIADSKGSEDSMYLTFRRIFTLCRCIPEAQGVCFKR
jgi:glutamine amidotransferase PdxT